MALPPLRRILLSCLGALPLAACTAYAPPQLTVTRAAITDETPDGVVISFSIDAVNQNSVELPLRDVRYTLSVDDHPVFTGVRSPEATLRRLGTQPITIPAVIKLDAQHPRPAGVVNYSIDGRLTYATPGEIAQRLYDLHIYRPTAPFHQHGTIDLTKSEHAQAANDSPASP